MNEKLMAGLAMILGSIGTIGFYSLDPVSGIFAASDSPAWTGDKLAFMGAMGTNSKMVGLIMLLTVLTITVTTAGFTYVRNSMMGGKGELYAKLGYLMIAVMIPIWIVINGMVAASAEAASIGQAGFATGLTLYSGSVGIGTIGTIVAMIGFSLLGAGMLIQKHYHITVAILLILTGIVGVVITGIQGFDSSNMTIVWSLWVLSSVLTGILTIRSQN